MRIYKTHQEDREKYDILYDVCIVYILVFYGIKNIYMLMCFITYIYYVAKYFYKTNSRAIDCKN